MKLQIRQEILKNIVGKKWKAIDKIRNRWYFIHLLFSELKNGPAGKGERANRRKREQRKSWQWNFPNIRTIEAIRFATNGATSGIQRAEPTLATLAKLANPASQDNGAKTTDQPTNTEEASKVTNSRQKSFPITSWIIFLR